MTKECINGFFTKLSFKKLAKRIPPELRRKVPVLDKVIPFSNQIGCGLVVFGIIFIIACSGGKS
jgi:hypothetical protein